jgi:HK97 family phage major capsid protein
MSETNVVEQLAGEIKGKLDALDEKIGAAVTDEQLEAKVRDALEGLLGTEEGDDIVRKLRFGNEGDDKLKGSKFGRLGMSASDIEFLHNLTTSAFKRGVKDAQPPSDELEKAFKAVSDGEYVSPAQAYKRDVEAIDAFYDRLPDTPLNNERRLADIRNAMDTGESGFGSQLVGAQYVGELWEAPRKLGRVANLINTFPMSDPTAYLPIEAGLPEMLLVAESTANNSSNYDTVKTGSNRVAVSAKKFVIHQMWSGEMEEDSIIPFVPFLRGQAGKSVAHYLDSCVLNGDTTNTSTGNINLDDADPADTKHYLAYDGIRHAALVDNTGNTVNQAGAGITYAALTGLRGLMVDATYLTDWGHPVDPSDLVFVADPFTADKIALLDEVITVDKYGQNATVVNGEVGNIGRNPLVSTIAMSLTEADGKVSTTGSNNILGQVAVFNKTGFVIGWRRQVQVEVERIPATDQTRIVYSLRNGLGRYAPSGSASSIEAAAVIRNIGL